MASRRVVITTFGSLGDLHPYLAVGQALQRRGYDVRIGTVDIFRERIEDAGLGFAPVRAAAYQEPTPALVRRVLQSRTGMRYLVRDMMMPSLRLAYEDTLAAAADADLLISHPLTFATSLVAQRLRKPWLSTQLAPFGMASALDRPVLPGLTWLRPLGAGPGVYRFLLRLADRMTRRWVRPLDALRAELGLPRLREAGNPLFAGGHSPFGVLALFSPLFGPPQLDWPPRVTATGFPFFPETVAPNPALDAWLDAGPEPFIFTLGSSAVIAPGDFFRASAAAARRLGQRALLVGVGAQAFTHGRRLGDQAVSGTASFGGEDVLAVPYASYAQVFPRGAAIVHQGGIGTTAEALRAGRPMLVVPFGVDQPDNAARAERLGVGRVVPERRYRVDRVITALRALLGPAYRSRAAEVGAAIRREDGAEAAAEAIERVLGDRL